MRSSEIYQPARQPPDPAPGQSRRRRTAGSGSRLAGQQTRFNRASLHADPDGRSPGSRRPVRPQWTWVFRRNRRAGSILRFDGGGARIGTGARSPHLSRLPFDHGRHFHIGRGGVLSIAGQQPDIRLRSRLCFCGRTESGPEVGQHPRYIRFRPDHRQPQLRTRRARPPRT